MNDESHTDTLRPETRRLLGRIAGYLLLFAGVMALLAFAAGILREGQARWPLLALAAVFLALPGMIRRMDNGGG